MVHDNPWFLVRKNDVLRPDGNDGVYYTVEHKPLEGRGGVEVLPITKEGKILLVRIARFTEDVICWEVPAGGQEQKDQDILETAKRELSEETGYSTDKFKVLYNPYMQLVGCATVKGNVVLAHEVEKISNGDMFDEGISEIKQFSLEEAEEMIKNGEIVDAQSIVAIYFYKLYLEDLK